jgi:hypothetical protein
VSPPPRMDGGDAGLTDRIRGREVPHYPPRPGGARDFLTVEQSDVPRVGGRTVRSGLFAVDKGEGVPSSGRL